jgi:HSP20 family protein
MLFNLNKQDKKQPAENNAAVFGDQSEKWFSEDFTEGQLLVDIYQTDDKVVVKAPMAGVDPENLDISLDNDLLTIKGQRKMDQIDAGSDYIYKECYWGSFSRSLVLPTEVDSRQLEAFLENGVLTITLTKIGPAKKIEVKIK